MSNKNMFSSVYVARATGFWVEEAICESWFGDLNWDQEEEAKWKKVETWNSDLGDWTNRPMDQGAMSFLWTLKLIP